MFKRYRIPDAVGWLGWFEDADGKAFAFLGLDGKMLFMYEIE